MSITVARLVRNGYVTSRRDAHDARRIALTLTPKGARVKDQNTILEPQLVKEIFRLIPAAELESALQGIERIAKYANILLRQRKRARDK